MKEETNEYHVPVLLHESIEGLEIKPEGTYVDATFGGGGHSSAILKQLSKKGKLIAFDRDADAQNNLLKEKNLTLIHSEFTFLKNFLRYLNINKVDGILADLGVSSHQFDEAERGFTFRADALLDMRMDRQNPVTARDILNTYSQDELQRMFSKNGEIRNSRTLAMAVVKRRESSPIQTTQDLVEIGEGVLPARENLKKYLAPVFQALRIEVNDELNGLQHFLNQCYDVLDEGGKLAVITYHSLEDRIVKNFLAEEQEGSTKEEMLYGKTHKKWKTITRKPVVAGAEELKRNPRARSAKLRVAEKI